ncbi:MAG TPA: hypothetical protein PKD85_18270, partial [Saprospiraceae bacterium]|nr:hypothetical protein [Saprospiraceae bacterium]
MKINNLLITFLIILLVSCHKESPIEKELPDKPLSSCGPLEYFHSMFVINNECWGENQPQNGLLNKNSFFQSVIFESKYKNYNSIFVIGENQNFSDNKRFYAFFSIIEGGDGLLSTYIQTFHIDNTGSILLTFNQDSTELQGEIKDL